MIYDIHQELRDFVYITNVYKCISNYNLKGHQIGRKIGDMLEIITMGGVYASPALLTKLETEGKLEGYTSAGHKVEFGFYENPRTKTDLFGAIECKCVGVEETTAGKGQAHLRRLSIGNSFSLDFNGRWMHHPITQTITLISVHDSGAIIRLTNSTSAESFDIELLVGENIKITVDENENILHTTPHGNMLDEVPGLIRVCKTIKLDKVNETSAQFSLYNCLTGPQTIEKAKQASLVAMDLRKKIDGHWGKEDIQDGQGRMSFVHVLCEFSHWEDKSRNVIRTCIDHNIIVPDAVVIKAFEIFEEKFGLENMLDMISKKQFERDSRVREAIKDIFDYFEDHIFYEIACNAYVRFDYIDGKLVLVQLA